MKLSERIAEKADQVLEAILLSDPLEGSDAQLQKKMSRVAHPDLWPCDFHLVDDLADDLEGGGRYYLLHDEGEPPAVWPIDYGFTVIGDSETQIAPDEIAFTRAVTVQPPEVRGLVRFVPPRMLAIYQGVIKNGRREAWRDIYGQIAGHWTWLDLEGNATISNLKGDQKFFRVHRTKEAEATMQRNIEICLSAPLTERYSWHVAFGYREDGPRLVLPTNPTGCLSLFRGRDKAPGLSRRAALRHWVSTYYRSQNDDPGAIVYVRDHLRGQREFIWNGLFCELMVSAYDLEKNELFKHQAAEWRAQRRHNRVRLRRKA